MLGPCALRVRSADQYEFVDHRLGIEFEGGRSFRSRRKVLNSIHYTNRSTGDRCHLTVSRASPGAPARASQHVEGISGRVWWSSTPAKFKFNHSEFNHMISMFSSACTYCNTHLLDPLKALYEVAQGGARLPVRARAEPHGSRLH